MDQNRSKQVEEKFVTYKFMSTSYQCSFCGATFVREVNFLKHRCRKMEKVQQFKTVEGQAAWQYYKTWMKSQQKFVSTSKAFLNSRFFKSFFDFAHFVKKVHLPNVPLYINLMVKRKISPVSWTKDEAYRLYLEHYDVYADPLEQVDVTVKLIMEYAEEANVPPSEIFNLLTPSEIAQLIRQRRFTPWLLLNSTKFKHFLVNCNQHDRLLLQGLIRPAFWKQRIASYSKIKQIKKIISALKL